VILVIGDSCTDVYHYGYTKRLAPEGPVPVFHISKTVKNGGMAKNVCENIHSLGAECEMVTNTCDVTKTRYVDDRHNHLLLRVDSHERKVERVQDLWSIDFSKYESIVISDYDHGFLTESDIEFIASECSGTTFLDTKKKLGSWCKQVDYIKINEFEFENTKHTIDPDIKDKLIVTLSKDGCSFRGKTYGVKEVEVKDMTGAGDTFLASLVVSMHEGKTIEKSIEVANKNATIIVQQKGVAKIGDHI
jgi:bifunctional ADP-heptose synthase (sugar kinase/adenylyltransferase)